MKRAVSVPQGCFQGTNFMTPEWLAYYHGKHAGHAAYVELSTGRGIDGGPIFGVTVRRANGERFSPDPSKLFHSRAAAEAYITAGLREDP